MCEVRDEVMFAFNPETFYDDFILVFSLNIAVILAWHNHFALLYFIFVTVFLLLSIICNWKSCEENNLAETQIVFQACITIAIIKYLQFEGSTCSSETKTYCFEVIHALPLCAVFCDLILVLLYVFTWSVTICRGSIIHRKYFYCSVSLIPLTSALSVRMWIVNVNYQYFIALLNLCLILLFDI